MSDIRIGDEVYIHGFVDEVRKDAVIIKNEGGYFGTVADEIMPSARPEQRWIPCSEGLPKKDGRYQVTRHDDVTNTEFIDILWYEKNTWWNRQATGDYAVTAWMPLPEPYRAERRTDEKKDI